MTLPTWVRVIEYCVLGTFTVIVTISAGGCLVHLWQDHQLVDAIRATATQPTPAQSPAPSPTPERKP